MEPTTLVVDSARYLAFLERSKQIERERDKLIEGCIAESWRRPPRTMANVDDSGVIEHGWEWRYGAMGDFVATKELAVATVRAAAGLPLAPGGQGEAAGKKGEGHVE